MGHHPGWKVTWQLAERGLQAGFPSYQVFTSPEGVEYVRTKDSVLADVTISDFATPGLGPLYLKCRSRPFTAVHGRSRPFTAVHGRSRRRRRRGPETACAPATAVVHPRRSP